QAAAFRAAAGRDGLAVWLAGPDGDPQFARAAGDLVARGGAAELEVIYGSWDPPGARLLDAVAVMDQLRSPGGCPWDAEQTHASLMPYLLEEAYEAYACLEEDDLDGLREELGDVLLQVLFHARLAEELADDERWTVDDVAGDLVDKLVRRHPHVFAGASVSGAAEVHTSWDAIKTQEKDRTSVTDGVSLGQPALTLAATLLRRAERSGLDVDALQDQPCIPGQRRGGEGAELGRRLLALVAGAGRAGLDPEAELRAAARELRDRIRAAEAGKGAAT
ncbi:MAG: MazG family protein, partial [Actinomycetota bacterium]|nr:MazG family protein [Actinomycetota bacterium]